MDREDKLELIVREYNKLILSLPDLSPDLADDFRMLFARAQEAADSPKIKKNPPPHRSDKTQNRNKEICKRLLGGDTIDGIENDYGLCSDYIKTIFRENYPEEAKKRQFSYKARNEKFYKAYSRCNDEKDFLKVADDFRFSLEYAKIIFKRILLEKHGQKINSILDSLRSGQSDKNICQLHSIKKGELSGIKKWMESSHLYSTKEGRNIKIFCRWIELGENKGFTKIAEEFSLSKARVSQIIAREKRSLEKREKNPKTQLYIYQCCNAILRGLSHKGEQR